MPRRILVTGASIAGNTAAWWLAPHGADVTVVERADGFRDGGQNIDVRGTGRTVLAKMGLEQTALDAGTGEEGTAWIDVNGKVAAEFRTDDLGGEDGPTAEMEVLRGDLARLLYDAARGTATFRFGDAIASVSEHGEEIAVRFEGGAEEHYDLVVVAEGVGSATREMLFPDENDPRWMDLTIAYFTIPRTSDDDRMWRWYHATDGRAISLRPDRHGTTRAMLSVQHEHDGEQDWDVAAQKAWLRKTFADAGWQAPRVLAAMDETDDFYFDVLRQVRLPRWSKGRVVLTGDAAWCATPLAGVGATLAITGAFVLAGELALTDDTAAALAAYERAMRPMVEEAQGVPKLGTRLMNPHSRLGIHLLHGALGAASLPAVRGPSAKLFSREPEAPVLSLYPEPRPTR